MCQSCHRNEPRNCANCAHDCKVGKYGTEFACGAHVFKHDPEREKKIQTAIDKIWEEIEADER